MPGIATRPIFAAFLALCSSFSFAQEEAADVEVVISVAEQRMILLREGMWVEKFKVSTSKFGIGDSFGSYKTPLGRHRVCDKIGDGLPVGSVIKHRNATGEVLPVNAPGRDPIVTRILWLEGTEQKNANAKSRGIYIHGTVEEDKIGQPVSYGCIRMRSRDVVDLFQSLPVGTIVSIQQEKLPHYKRWSPQPTIILASKTQPKTLAKVAPEKVSDPERKQSVEKIGSPKPETKLVAAKAAEKSRARTVAGVEPVEMPERVDPEPLNKPRVSFGGAAALAALKGSILLSDIPGHGPKVDGLTKHSRTTLEPVAESVVAAEQLPRVTFRAPITEQTLR